MKAYVLVLVRVFCVKIQVAAAAVSPLGAVTVRLLIDGVFVGGDSDKFVVIQILVVYDILVVGIGDYRVTVLLVGKLDLFGR